MDYGDWSSNKIAGGGGVIKFSIQTLHDIKLLKSRNSYTNP